MRNAIPFIVCLLILNSQHLRAQNAAMEKLILSTYSVYGSHKNPLINAGSESGSFIYVRSNGANTAMRYGIGVGERIHNIWNNSFVKQDTSIFMSNYASSNGPRIIMGKEYRKDIHPDVQIIGGSDFAFGGGAASDRQITKATFKNGETYSLNSASNGFAGYASLAPFTGVRVCWGGLVLGYSASLPIELDVLSQGKNGFLNFETRFCHNISAGYRFANKKNKKETN